MKRWLRRPLWRHLLTGLGALTLVVAVSSCHRGGWHGPYDAARFDERMDHVQQEIAEELEVKPQQQAEFDALMADVRQAARKWREGWHEAAVDARGALEREPADAAAVGELLKRRVRERPSDAELNALIDKSVNFYNSLDPAQQEEVRSHLLRHLRWRT